jgi:hypothetical protein
MSAITESSKIRVLFGATVAVAACAFAVACGQPPAGPTTGGSLAAAAQGTSQTWQDFAARGWNCRTPGGGAVTVCSPPNQPVVVPPPDDRPPTVMLKRWTNGVFDANVHWIRPEFYSGQICGPTGEAYRLLAIVGYYECVFPVGS